MEKTYVTITFTVYAFIQGGHIITPYHYRDYTLRYKASKLHASSGGDKTYRFW